jgi:hypothetical protein
MRKLSLILAFVMYSVLCHAQNNNVVAVGQVLGNGGTPSCAVNTTFAGAGATCTLAPSGAVSTDVSGRISLTTGTTPTATGTLITITLNLTHQTAFQSCHLIPQTAATDALIATVYTTAPTTTVWTISVGATPLTGATTYQWGYICQ